MKNGKIKMAKLGELAWFGKETGKTVVKASGQAIKTIALVTVAAVALGLGLNAVGGSS